MQLRSWRNLVIDRLIHTALKLAISVMVARASKNLHMSFSFSPIDPMFPFGMALSSPIF